MRIERMISPRREMTHGKASQGLKDAVARIIRACAIGLRERRKGALLSSGCSRRRAR